MADSTVEIVEKQNSEQRLRSRMVLLYDGSIKSIPINLLNGLIILAVFWETSGSSFVAIWLPFLLVISAIRMVISIYTLKHAETINPRLALRFFLIGAAITGTIWGSLAFAVPITGDTGLYFICVVFMIAGMTAGATSSASAYFPAGIWFNAPALLLLVFVFAQHNEAVTWVMAFVILVYGGLLTQIGRSTERTTRELMRQKDIVQSQNADIQAQRFLMQQVLDTIDPGVAVYDADFRLTYWNKSLLRYLGIPQDWPNTSRTMEDLIRKLADMGEYGDGNINDIVRSRMERIQSESGKIAHRYERERPNGERVQIVGNPMATGGLVSTYTDITEQHENIEKMRYIADHDSLTGLVNRPVFQSRLKEAMASAKRLGRIVSIYYLDLDHFKDINDTLGHPVGDELLKSVAARIMNTVRDTDTVARLGGDEFAIVGVHQKSIDDCAALAERILKALEKPHILGSATIQSAASIGVTIFPYDDSSAVELESHADIALYKAKQAGRNGYAIFDDGMNEELAERKAVEADLSEAVENNEFVLFYQPKIDLKTGKKTGAEALIRWQHPSRGLLAPFAFLEIAEKSGKIGTISEWVIAEAAAFLGRIKDTAPAGFRLGINLSAADFRDENMGSRIRAELEVNGVPGSMLEVEITESMFITDLKAAQGTLAELKGMGVTIAIDDFGVGYSSMSYLKDFSADILKIDRSFIKDGFTDNQNARIVEGIINLGHSLGMKIVAEGVEDEDQAKFLTDADCEYCQGYFYGRPMPEQDFLGAL